MDLNCSHLAFSDESEHEDGQYKSLGFFTFPSGNEQEFRNELASIFSGVKKTKREFKWQNVKDKVHGVVANKLHLFIFKHLNKIRLDVLIWDMSDSRHGDVVVDYSANLGRMYYHLVQNSCKRWGNNTTWSWCPDELSCMDWCTLGQYLVSKKHKLAADLFGINQNSFMKLKLKAIKPVESHNEVFVQVADYFVGLGAYSYGHFNRYKSWEHTQSIQTSLFGQPETRVLSNSEKTRFPLLFNFNRECKGRALTVGLNSSCGLQTRNPSKPINFWFYCPQHVLDKAPQKFSQNP